MAAVFKVADGVPCRACGAVLGPVGANEYGLCGNCWTAAKLHCGATFNMLRKEYVKPTGKVTAEDVNAWLAYKLVKDIRRLTRDGIVGRCEAVSGWSYGNPGCQCALSAVKVRDGHKVCERHGRATAPVYVTDQQTDHYDMLRDIIRHLAGVDERFAQVIREVAA